MAQRMTTWVALLSVVVTGCASHRHAAVRPVVVAYQPGATPDVSVAPRAANYTLYRIDDEKREHPIDTWYVMAGKPLGFVRDAENQLEGVVAGHRWLLEDVPYCWRASPDKSPPKAQQSLENKIAESKRLLSQVSEPMGVVLYPVLAVFCIWEHMVGKL